jgi:hypothetical protein
MIGKRFAVSLTAAALMGAFGAAFAQSSGPTVNANPNAGVDASGGTSASTDTQGAASTDRMHGAAGGADAKANTDQTQSGAAVSGATSSGDRENQRQANDNDRAKGLDRADQAAGEHGKQGRDNAREQYQSGRGENKGSND